MSINKWIIDYDKATLEKRLIHDVNLLSFYDSIPRENIYNKGSSFSTESIVSILQKKLFEFIECFHQSFEEMAGLQETRFSTFSRLGFLYIGCEKFYIQESWVFPVKENKDLFIRLLVSFLRIKRLLFSLHKTLYINKETPALFLRALQGLLIEGVESVLVNIQNKEKFPLRELFINVFQILRHYCKGFLHKPHELLLQETVNLFGNASENTALEMINDLNKGLLQNNNELNPNSPIKDGEDGSVESLMKQSIMRGLSNLFQQQSFHELPELKQIQNEIASNKPKNSQNEKSDKNLFDEKVFDSYPCLNEVMNRNMKIALEELEKIDKIVKESEEIMLHSCQNSQDLSNIRPLSDISKGGSLEEIPLGEEQEFTYVSDLETNIEKLKKKGPKKFGPLQKLMNSHSFQIEDEKNKNKSIQFGNSHSFQIEENIRDSMSSKTISNESSNKRSIPNNTNLLEPPKQSFIGSKFKAKDQAKQNKRFDKKKNRKAGKAKTNLLPTPKLNISASDLIKIDSNTLITEELRHVEFIESDAGYLIRDSELFEEFEEPPCKPIGTGQRTFLGFMEKMREEEMIKPEGLYFRICVNKTKNSGNFIKRIQIHQEIQSLINKRSKDRKILERKAGYWDKFTSWGFKPETLERMLGFNV